jgi:D-alanyl-D-alanine dipeptidase
VLERRRSVQEVPFRALERHMPLQGTDVRLRFARYKYNIETGHEFCRALNHRLAFSMRTIPVVAGALVVLSLGFATSALGQDLIDVQTLDATIRADIRYAGPDNFVGEPVDGYEAPKCLLSRAAAEALAGVQSLLREDGLGLYVFDCYRPQRGVDHFVRWAADTADVRTKAEYYPNVQKSRLFKDGYIASRSGHSRASTVDLTLARLADDGPGGPLDMGTAFDFLDPLSTTESPEITPKQLANRLLLRTAMEDGGFRNYAAEWWHYTSRDEPFPDEYFDVVVR